MEKVCFPKLLLPVPFLTLKFKQVLGNFHKGVQDMDFTEQSTVWQHSAALGTLEREVHLHSSKKPWGEIIAHWWQTLQAVETQQSPGPEFSCMQKYLGLSPLVVYCQCWVTSPFPLCSISSWISFYVCDSLLGSTCLCCFPHFL